MRVRLETSVKSENNSAFIVILLICNPPTFANKKDTIMNKNIITMACILMLQSLTSCGADPINDISDSSTISSNGPDKPADGTSDGNQADDNTSWFSGSSTVGDVIRDEAFNGFGSLLFPVDRQVSPSMTLAEVSSSSVYVWYTHIQTSKTVEILNRLKQDALDGHQIFFPIYTEAEIQANPSKRYTGLFFFRGNPGKEFAVMNAGGGFMYVGAMHDSFPHALEVSKKGYNCFALIYRPDDPYDDLARALTYIHSHADELGVKADGYSLWGGSAGARMAATLGNGYYLRQLTGSSDVPQAAAVVMQYTGYNLADRTDAPTYANVGTNDGIASWQTMQNRLKALSNMGIPTEFHVYQGLGHGFGIGQGTVAEGWVDDAVRFWERQIMTSSISTPKM